MSKGLTIFGMSVSVVSIILCVKIHRGEMAALWGVLLIWQAALFVKQMDD